jgi:hypothetical protein
LIYEYESSPPTVTSDRACQCGAPDNTILLASIQLSKLDISILDANLTEATGLATAIVESIMQEASSLFLSRISANFLVSVKGPEDVVPIAESTVGDGVADLSEEVDLETILGLYSLLPCLTSLQGVSPLLPSTASRRREIVFSESAAVAYTVSVPQHIARDVGCLLFDASMTKRGAVLDTVRETHLHYINDDTSLINGKVAFANGSCACGCVDVPVAPSNTSDDALPNWLVALLVLVLLALFVLLLLVYRRRQQQADYIGPPSKLPAYIAAPLYTEDLDLDVEEPFVSRRTAPPYQPPPIWTPRLRDDDFDVGPSIPQYEHPPEYFDIMDYEPVDPEDVFLSDEYPYSENGSVASSHEASDSLFSDTSDWYLTDGNEVEDYMQPPRSLERYLDPPDIFDIASEPRQRPHNVPSYEQAPSFSDLNEKYFNME